MEKLTQDMKNKIWKEYQKKIGNMDWSEERAHVELKKKYKLTDAQIEDILGSSIPNIEESSKTKLDKILLEFAKEITDFYTIVVKDGNKSRRFSFESKRPAQLEKELKKYFGDRVVKGIMKEIDFATKKGELKNFAVDDSIDFEVNGDELFTLIRRNERIKVEEGFAEYYGKNWSGSLSTEMIHKIHMYIHKRYGLDSISLNDGKPDVAYDKDKQSFIVTFEKPAKDPATGKILSTISVPFNVIVNQK